MIPEYRSVTRHPFLSLINLLFLSLAGMLVFMLLGILFIYLIEGQQAVSGLVTGNYTIDSLKTFQLFISVGTFVIPAWAFSYKEGFKPLEYFQLNRSINIKLLLLATVITFSITPFIEWTILVNQKMVLPDFLQGIETWMREKEEQAAILTREFLRMNSVNDLMFNLLVIAVIPAIGEELLFRGCIQKIFAEWTRNHHWGIWIAAVIFSAIHFQFYGFLPRMLLGALFGYMFFWSKNLLIPIIAHFVNNASQVFLAYFYQKDGKSIDELEQTSQFPFYLSILSLFFTIVLLVVFYRSSPLIQNTDERGLD